MFLLSLAFVGVHFSVIQSELVGSWRWASTYSRRGSHECAHVVVEGLSALCLNRLRWENVTWIIKTKGLQGHSKGRSVICAGVGNKP